MEMGAFVYIYDSSRINYSSIDRLQPGYILLCTLSTRNELEKAPGELIE